MDKDILLKKIKENKFSHEQLLNWVKALPASSISRKPSSYKVGDVFMHSVFKHPYVILSSSKSGYICGLLTTEENCPEILEACKSRFFSESYFTQALFTVTEIHGSFLNVYENKKQLREVLEKLKHIFI